MGQYDVVVIGGGPSGVCAALAAARTGAKTLLVTDRPVLGGNSSSEIRVWSRGATGGGNLFAEEMGIWGELRLKNLAVNPQGRVLAWDDCLLDAVLSQENLTFLLNTMVLGVEMDGSFIKAITLRGLRTEQSFLVAAKEFVDCTGDGFVAKSAGVPFRTGREDKQAFDEPLALQTADNHSQGCSILIQSKRTGKKAPYIAPDYAYSIEKIERLVGRGGRVVTADMQGSDCWWFEYGGQLDVLRDDQKIGLELRAIALGIWNYIKNSGKFGAEDLALEWLGYYPGRRASRRMVGEETLVQQDVTDDLQRENAIAYGGWYMDSHPSGGLLSEKEQCLQRAVACYGIPFGTLYNARVSNLLFAGRCISMSYVAFTSARIMNTCALLGQAAGTAAALCARSGQTALELSTRRLSALRQRLTMDDALLTPLPLDSFLRADSVEASSKKQAVIQETDARLPLTQEAFVVFPAAPGHACTLFVDCDEDTCLSCCVSNSALPSRRVSVFDGQQTVTIVLKKGRQALHFSQDGQGFIQLRFKAAEHVALVGGTRQQGVLAGYSWEAELFYPLMALSLNAQYAPQNVQDGYLRPWNGLRAWVSDGVSKEGEALTLRFEHSQTISSLLLMFDPELSMELSSSHCEQWDSHHHYQARDGMPKDLIKDYELIAQTKQGEQTLVSVSSNILRRRLHEFAPVQATAITLRVRATYGGDAVVYAMLPNPKYDR